MGRGGGVGGELESPNSFLKIEKLKKKKGLCYDWRDKTWALLPANKG